MPSLAPSGDPWSQAYSVLKFAGVAGYSGGLRACKLDISTDTLGPMDEVK